MYVPRRTASLLAALSLLPVASSHRALAHPLAARAGIARPAASAPAVTAAPPVPVCQTVITITQAPPSPTAQTTANVTVAYGEVITSNPVCLSVEGGQSFAFTVNGVDRTTYFTYGYNATTGSTRRTGPTCRSSQV